MSMEQPSSSELPSKKVTANITFLPAGNFVYVVSSIGQFIKRFTSHLTQTSHI
jgi:hypothetical protein